MRTINQWIEVVMRDFESTPVAHVVVSLIDLDPARLDTVAGVLPDASSWVSPVDPDAHRLLLTVSENVTSLDEFADDPPAAAVEIASYLQDVVADELNRPWPEVIGDGGRTTVLEPRLGDGNRPEWAGRGMVCAFGELRDQLGV